MQNPHVLQLYGFIGSDLTAAGLQYQLDQLAPDTPLLVRINSDGGSVAEGMAMFATLRQWRAQVTTEVVGWCLSVASAILMAGSVRRMHETSLVMVHAPWTPAGGNAGELRQRADLLDVVAQSMRAAYALTGQPPAVLDQWFNGEDHWFTAEQAVSAGLATELVPSAAAVAAIPAGIFAARHPVPPNLSRRIHLMPSPVASGSPAFNGNQPPAPTFQSQSLQTPGVDAIRAEAIRAEGERRDGIRAQFQSALRMGSHIRPELEELMARCESDPTATPASAGQQCLALLARGVGPASGGPSGAAYGMHQQDNRLAEFQAAAADVLLMRGGVQVAEPHPASRDLARLSLVTIAERMLSMQGRSTRDLSPGQILAAGMSTSDLPNLLSNVAGKALRMGYQNAPATFTGWTGEREVPDHKPATLVNLSEAPSLLLKSEFSEYKAGSLTDSATTFKAGVFGRMLLVSREMMLADDLGAFTSLPLAWGNAARRREADEVYTLLQASANLPDGTPLFHASRGNLAAAGAAPSISSIGEARAAMRRQRDIGGVEFIDPQPRYLIVPVSLETAYSTPSRTPFRSDGGQHSAVMADTVPD